jgi:hypothetical protein
LDLKVPAFGLGDADDPGDALTSGEEVALGLTLAAFTATVLLTTPAARAPRAPDPAKTAPAAASFIRFMTIS